MQAPNSHFVSPSGLWCLSPKYKEWVSEAAWAEAADRGDRPASSADQAPMGPRSWHTVMTSWSLVQLLKMHPIQGPAYVTPTSMTDIWAREDKAGSNSHTLGLLQMRFGHRETVQSSLVDGMLTGRPSCTAFFALAHTPLLSMNHSEWICRSLQTNLWSLITIYPSKTCVLQSSHFKKCDIFWNLFHRIFWMLLLAEPHRYPGTTNKLLN